MCYRAHPEPQRQLLEKNVFLLAKYLIDIQSDAIQFLSSITDDWCPQIE